jgi:alpha-beta hydrolase superfamily lysophospholipase
MAELIHDPESDLTYRAWTVDGAKAVLVLVHGLGAHSGRWQCLAQFAAAKNIACYAVELKGFGQNCGTRGHADSWQDYYRDIAALCGLARRQNPHAKIFLAGESFGGLVAFGFAQEQPQAFDGLICLSPAFVNTLKVSPWKYAGAFLSLALGRPARQFKVPFNLGMITRDQAMIQALRDDPAEHRLMSARLFWLMFKRQLELKSAHPVLKVPVLFLVAGDDLLVSSCASRRLFQRLVAPAKKLIEYPGMRHALSIDLGRERVFGDIVNWIDSRGGACPSRYKRHYAGENEL